MTSSQMSTEKEIVIAGISGRFPECDSVIEFWEKLISGEDLVTEDERRWEKGIRGAPPRAGKLKELSLFDAEFFGMPRNQAQTMDPQARILLELCYEAIVDAGVNPVTLRGSNTGVFVGCSANDVIALWSRKRKIEGAENLALFGSAPSLLANRISYVFDFTGPSVTVDSACSASLYALHSAVESLRTGRCDAALVAGTNLLLNPMVSGAMRALGATSQAGRCRSFDDGADGYARSEGAVVLLLQRAHLARREYATVLGVGVNADGHKPRSFAFPSRALQAHLLRRVLSESGVSAGSVCYLELHGTGTRAGDPEELNAVDEVYCEDRDAPLHVGSVKSNMGHAEGASGLCALVKVLLSMKFGQIPANLHYRTPNSRVPALVDGRIKVVTTCQPFQGDYVGINSFGVGGANAHLIVRRPNLESMKKAHKIRSLPLVVGVSGRTREAVDKLLDRVEHLPTDEGLVSLLHEIHSVATPGHPYRGHSIVTTDGTSVRTVQKQSETRTRPVWFVFSGFGGQWPTMGGDLLQIPAFHSAVDACNNALAPFDVNLMDVFKDATDEVMHNFRKGFVANVAIQIGLVDVLGSLGIEPDGIVGHSLGEIASGYADGCLTREQAILAAYHRADAVSTGRVGGGAMLAVRLSADAVGEMVSPDIELACDNGPDSVTLSGEVSAIRELAASLQGQGVFAREVAIGGVAFHSRHVALAGARLVGVLRETIVEPRARSDKWISSSVERCQWGSELARTCSAEYLAHNLTSRVRFRDAAGEIPANAVVIELGPHGLLQGALRGMLPPSASCLALLTKTQSGVHCLAASLGRLYNYGLQPRLSALYPPARFPVHPDTATLSPLVGWNHEQEWYVPRFEDSDDHFDKTSIDLAREEDAWYRGHKIDGRVIFPGTGYLVLAWKTLATALKMSYDQVPVVFRDVRFLRTTILPEYGEVQLCVSILAASGQFEVTENGNMAASGIISVVENPDEETVASSCDTRQELKEPLLKREDVYKELCLRGYQYSGIFQTVSEVAGNRATVQATSNWMATLDSLLQVALVCDSKQKRRLYLPTRIRKVIVDPRGFPTGNQVTVIVDKLLGTVTCPGLQMMGIDGSVAQRSLPAVQPLLEHVAFIPYHGFRASSLDQALQLSTQIIVENTNASGRRGTRLVVADFSGDPEITRKLEWIVEKMPGLEADFTFIGDRSLTVEALTDIGVEISAEASNCNIVISREINTKVVDTIGHDGFLLVLCEALNSLDNSKVLLASFKLPDDQTLYLVRKECPRGVSEESKVVRLADEESFHWLQELKASTGDVLFVVEPRDPCSGVVGLVNCLRLERRGCKIRCVYIQDPLAPEFCPTASPYREQLSLGLTMNVYRGGEWGAPRHLRVADRPPTTVAVDDAYVSTTGAGGVASLRWIQGPQESKETFCHVYCSALNFHDVMVASGKLPVDVLPAHLALQDCVIGMEFSGRDALGRRVMGMVPSRGIATRVLAPYVWEVPEQWTLEEAATVPVVYCTAYYALVVRGRLRPGESVLIHAGTGGVGQAAIAIALHMGCTVFTTVGSAEKRAFLKDRFHQLTDRNIANSRSTSFEQHILQQTDGRGVDVVLNSLAQDKLLASVRCLAENGRFLEIGQFDLAMDQPLGLGVFLKNVSFHGIRLDTVLSSGNTDECLQLFAMVQQGIDTGVVKPLPQIVFMAEQVQEAFRFMAAGSHIGKVLIRIREEEKTSSGHCLVVKPSVRLVDPMPRFHARHESVYVITGGLGGFGLELSDWLVCRGARHLVLSSRTGRCSGYASLRTARWRDAGVSVRISTSDVTTERGTEELLREAGTQGDVVGIFHLAAVLQDALLKKQTKESFQAVWAPKTCATRNLDLISRHECPALQHFVVFSSATAGRGNPGQTNYGLASSAAERIVEIRKACGYPALAIQWGPIAVVGLAAGLKESLLPSGVRLQSVDSCLDALETFLLDDRYAVVASILVRKDMEGKRSEANHGKEMLETLASVLGLADFRQMPPNTRLTEIGLDSLMQVELASRLERTLNIKLGPKEIRTLSVGRLLEMVDGLQQGDPNQHSKSKKLQEGRDLQLSRNEVTNAEGVKLARNETNNQDPVKNAEGVKLPRNEIKNQDKTRDSSSANLNNRDELINVFQRNVSALVRFNFLSPHLVPEKTPILLDSSVVDDGMSSPLFLVHPAEGSCKSVEGVARFIDRPVYGLQFTADAPRTTIGDLAAFYLKSVRALQSEGPYLLGGYSLGAAVAVEMALQLDAGGERSSVLSLDGIATLNVGSLDESTREFVDASLEREILVQLATQFQPSVDVSSLQRTLSSMSERSERLNHCLTLPGVARHAGTKQLVDLKEFVEGCLWRFHALMRHTPLSGTSIKGSVLVVAAASSFMKYIAGEDLGFQSICERKVKIVTVKGDHASFHSGVQRGMSVASIINDYLSDCDRSNRAAV